MNKWDELNDFSMYEGHVPCLLCKEESSRTVLGDHWKCSVCAHVFNQDGSNIGVECYCETCQKTYAKAHAAEDQVNEKGLKGILKKLKGLKTKKPSKKKKKKTLNLDE